MKKNLAFVLLLAGPVVMAGGCGFCSDLFSNGDNGEESWTARVAGSYKGDILTGEIVWPGITTFAVDDDGAITGTYELDERGTTVKGELSDFRVTGPGQLACRWKDKSGVGDFTVTFSEDFKSFEGLWSNDADEKKTKHGWGGKK